MFPTALAFLLLAAPPAPPTVLIEFDGKAGKNPSVPAPGVIAVSGTFTLPADGELIEIELEVTKRTPGPGPVTGRTLKATVDTTAKPHKWTARSDANLGGLFDPNEYLVRAVLRYADKQGKTWDEAWELRKVRVPDPAKK